MSQIPIEKQVFDKISFSRIIDTNFSQLISPDTNEPAPSFTLDDFFQLYEQLFNQIPDNGDINSHKYILEREAEYLGISLDKEETQALLDEITSLRQQVLDLQTALNDLATATNTRL
jgi:hypothetical protein